MAPDDIAHPPIPDHPVVDWSELTLTHRCNQRCFFCYEDGRDVAQEPPLERVQALLREQAKVAKLVVFCGREVLLRPDILDVVAYAAGLGLEVSVFSNGQELARPGLIEDLVAAGAASVVVSFHFPDPQVFARGARVKAERFERTLSGLRRLAAYNLAHPSRPLFLSTETDMFALNLGRLCEMRQTLIDALGQSPWQMRVGSLLPTETYDIGLDHILEPLEARRAELVTFLDTHPDWLPLKFVKVPLCVLPRAAVHRSLEIEYLYNSTVLTFNHQQTEQVTRDPWTTSTQRDVAAALRPQPYRWLCRACELAPLCRFERLDWALKGFRPRREHKPSPVHDLSAGAVLSRLGPATAGVAYVAAAGAQLNALRFPEEQILDSLRALPAGAPTLADAWVDEEPLLVVMLRHAGRDLALRLLPPRWAQKGQALPALVDYLELRPVDPADAASPAFVAALETFAGLALPDPQRFAGDAWFIPEIAALYRLAWRALGRALWPGRGRVADFATFDVRLDPEGRLVVTFVGPADARVDLVLQTAASAASGPVAPVVRVSIAGVPPGATPPVAAYRALLADLAGRLGGDPAASIDFDPERLAGERLDLHFRDGHFCQDAAPAGEPGLGPASPAELRFIVRERAHPEAPAERFFIAPYVAGQPAFRRVGDLVVWYGRGTPSPAGRDFLRVLLTVMRRFQRFPRDAAEWSHWLQAVEAVASQVGGAARFDWQASWAGAAPAA